jgi:hypothetical protein
MQPACRKSTKAEAKASAALGPAHLQMRTHLGMLLMALKDLQAGLQ